MGPHSHPLCRDGTTDITRTVHWGTPTPLQKVLALWGAPNTMGPGGCPAHHHAQPPHSLIGSLHPCADGQHRPLPPRLPIGHSWWVWSRCGGSRAGVPLLLPALFHLLILQGEQWRPLPAGRSGKWGSTTATELGTASAISSLCMSVSTGGGMGRDGGGTPVPVSHNLPRVPHRAGGLPVQQRAADCGHVHIHRCVRPPGSYCTGVVGMTVGQAKGAGPQLPAQGSPGVGWGGGAAGAQDVLGAVPRARLLQGR